MKDVIVYGLGELGRLLAGGALRAGYRVTPLVRGVEPETILNATHVAAPIVVCVGETELPAAIEALPIPARSRLILLQNELFPDVWAPLSVQRLTLMVPWLLQKKGQPQIQMRTTPIYGRYAEFLVQVHEALGLGCEVLSDERPMHEALAAKYALIVAINALGSLQNRTMGQWLQQAPAAVEALTRDAAAIAAARLPDADSTHLAEISLPQVQSAMRSLENIPSAGRTAAQRVERALEVARAHSVSVPALEQVARGELPSP